MKRASELKPGNLVWTRYGTQKVQRVVFMGRGWYGVEFKYLPEPYLFKIGGTNDDAKWDVLK